MPTIPEDFFPGYKRLVVILYGSQRETWQDIQRMTPVDILDALISIELTTPIRDGN